jgi:hypothetical protein
LVNSPNNGPDLASISMMRDTPSALSGFGHVSALIAGPRAAAGSDKSANETNDRITGSPRTDGDR